MYFSRPGDIKGLHLFDTLPFPDSKPYRVYAPDLPELLDKTLRRALPDQWANRIEIWQIRDGEEVIVHRAPHTTFTRERGLRTLVSAPLPKLLRVDGEWHLGTQAPLGVVEAEVTFHIDAFSPWRRYRQVEPNTPWNAYWHSTIDPKSGGTTWPVFCASEGVATVDEALDRNHNHT